MTHHSCKVIVRKIRDGWDWFCDSCPDGWDAEEPLDWRTAVDQAIDHSKKPWPGR